MKKLKAGIKAKGRHAFIRAYLYQANTKQKYEYFTMCYL